MKSAEVVADTRETTGPRMRTIVAATVALGVALRLAFAFGYWVDKPLTLDEQEYLLLGTSVARGEGLTYPEPAQGAASHFERPPVFAVLVGGVLRATGNPLVSADRDGNGVPRGFPRSSSDVPAAVRIVQCLIGGLGVALVAALGFSAAGAGGAVTAGAIAAVYPPVAWFSGYVLSEPLYSALALAVVWLLQRETVGVTSAWRRSLPVLAAGIVAGIGVLTKEGMLFFLPLAGLWLLARRGLAQAAVLTLGVALVLTPWIARNYAVHGRFVLTAPHGGVTFWTGNNPLATGEGDLAANPEMARARVAFERQHAGASASELDSAYYGEALRFIAGHPLQWTALLARKVFYTFVPIGPSYRLHSTRYVAATLAAGAALLPFAALGLIGMVRHRRMGRLTALWLLALSTVVMAVVFFPQERFRIPVLDPALIVCASAWLGMRNSVSRFVEGELQARS